MLRCYCLSRYPYLEPSCGTLLLSFLYQFRSRVLGFSVPQWQLLENNLLGHLLLLSHPQRALVKAVHLVRAVLLVGQLLPDRVLRSQVV